MSRRVECDRCGTYLPANTPERDAHWLIPGAGTCLDPGRKYILYVREVDLCQECVGQCAKLLDGFLKGHEKAVSM